MMLDCEADYSHMKEMARVEELGRMLTDIQKSTKLAVSKIYYAAT